MAEVTVVTGFVWDTYVDRCKKVGKEVELSINQLMCNGCWTKVRLAKNEYAHPVPTVAPDPISIATPEDSPRAAAAVAAESRSPSADQEDPLGASTSSDTSTKSANIMYISADQTSAAYVAASSEDDRSAISQAPVAKDEKLPGTAWKLPCDDINYDKVREGFWRLDESLQQIPKTPSQSDPEDDEQQDEDSTVVDTMPRYMPDGSGEDRNPAAPWSMVNPVGLTDTCKEFVVNAAYNVRQYASYLVEFVKQWDTLEPQELIVKVDMIQQMCLSRSDIVVKKEVVSPTVIDQNDEADYGETKQAVACHVCNVSDDINPLVHGTNYVQSLTFSALVRSDPGSEPVTLTIQEYMCPQCVWMDP